MYNSIKDSRLSKDNRAISKMQSIGFAIIVCIAIAVGVYYAFLASPATVPPPQPPITSPPDLVVTKIVIDPAQPPAMQYFRVEVWVANEGETRSGSYNLLMHMKDWKDNYYFLPGSGGYLQGKFPQDPVNPKQNVLAWESDLLLVNEAGWHTIYVEIDPVDFTDGNYNNNDFDQGFEAIGGY